VENGVEGKLAQHEKLYLMSRKPGATGVAFGERFAIRLFSGMADENHDTRHRSPSLLQNARGLDYALTLKRVSRGGGDADHAE